MNETSWDGGAKLCIYHGGCTDGVASAWVVNKAIPGVRFYPGVYQREPPWDLIDGADVLMVDFSYKAHVMKQIASRAQSVHVLDHHATAQVQIDPLITDGTVTGVFDMNRCGAVIAWDELVGGTRPTLLDHIDARDRWVTPTPAGNDEIIMALRSYPHVADVDTFATWDAFMSPHGIGRLRNEGVAIYRYFRARVDEAKTRATEWQIGQITMPCVDTNFAFCSEVAGELAAEHSSGVAACWWTSPGDTVTFSMRARGDFHAGQFCETFAGGGGHAGAAGFTIDTARVNLARRMVYPAADLVESRP